MADLDDFDKVPTTSTTMGIKNPRKKNLRKQLESHTCPECEKYFQETQTQETSSRHRGYERPKTPENFWELDFPSEEECIRRGYTNAVPEKYVMGKLKDNKYYKISVRKPYTKPNYLK